MFIARSPLRISLGGGGTDLPSYYRQSGGYLLASAIDKYVYTSIIKPYDEGIFLKYSSQEKVKKPSEIKHKIFKEILTMQNWKEPYQIEITTLADIPAGTGLGSSGAFTVSAIKAIQVFNSEYQSNQAIAELACHIEIDRLREPVGKQDQYISAIGGICEFIFNKDDSVEINRLAIPEEKLNEIKESILMFYTGKSRSASKVLNHQDKKTLNNDKEIIRNLDAVKEMGKLSKDLLINGDINQYGLLIQDHWKEKLKRSPDMCSLEIKNFIEVGMQNGALGGKLVGAGGGGFLMFIAKDKSQLRKSMLKIGLQELNFNIDKLGVHVIET